MAEGIRGDRLLVTGDVAGARAVYEAMLARLRAIDTTPGYEDPETFRASVQRTLRQLAELAESLDLYATG